MEGVPETQEAKSQKRDKHELFKFSSYKMGVSMNSCFLVTGCIYFKKKVFKIHLRSRFRLLRSGFRLLRSGFWL